MLSIQVDERRDARRFSLSGLSRPNGQASASFGTGTRMPGFLCSSLAGDNNCQRKLMAGGALTALRACTNFARQLGIARLDVAIRSWEYLRGSKGVSAPNLFFGRA
jgi:hypothetical protein